MGRILPPISRRDAHRINVPEGMFMIEADHVGKFKYTVDDVEKTISWCIIGNRVQLFPQEAFGELDLEQRAKLYHPMLAAARLDSRHSQNFFTSCLLVTTDNIITIAHNTDRQKLGLYKDCAEMEALGASPQGQFKEGAIMAGFDKAACPCGKCTDSLAANMIEGASLIIMPPSDGKGSLAFSRVHDYTKLQDGETWLTDMSVINRHSKFLLTSKQIPYTQEAREVITSGKPWTDKMSKSVQHVKTAAERFLHSRGVVNAPEASRGFIEASLRDSSDNRKHQLEADPSIVTMNNVLVNEVKHAYDALREKAKRKELPRIPEDLKIRAGIVCMSNGSRDESGRYIHKFEIGVEVIGENLSAVAPLEIRLAGDATSSSSVITDGIFQEFDLKDISDGIMHTSSKDGLEKLYKRLPSGPNILDVNGNPINGSINLIYIPSNKAGLKEDELNKLVYRLPIEQAFASGFKGVKGHFMALAEAKSNNDGIAP